MIKWGKVIIRSLIFTLLIIPTITEGASIIAGMKYNESLLKDWKVVCIEKSRNIDERNFSKRISIWAKKDNKVYRAEKNRR